MSLVRNSNMYEYNKNRTYKIKPVSITWPRWTTLAAASAAVGRLPAHIRLRV